MKFKKFISVMLITVLLVCTIGCSKNANNTESDNSLSETKKANKESLTLLYSSSDSFNPYTAETPINKQICQLLFEPLVTLDNNFNPVCTLAQTVTADGNKCTVTLNNAIFSDGSNFSADDVIYSYNIAKNSQSIYASKLYEVTSVTAIDSKTVVFKLSKIDPFFENLLTFPIIKSGSEKITDSDGIVLPPIGCGRYKLNNTYDKLVANENAFRKQGNIKTINLINSPDIESVTHYAQVGAADIYYSDISDGNILRMSGKKIKINLNTLIYIGINRNNVLLSNKLLRQALSSGIDRKEICHDAYFDNAVAANGFFHPDWNPTSSIQKLQITTDKEITIENLSKIGYNIKNDSTNNDNKLKNVLNFSLLVNSENRLKVTAAACVARELSQFGIKVNVVEKPYQQYIDDLNNGNFQLFIGEIKITDNMDFSSMLLKGGSAAYGFADYTQIAEAQEPATEKTVTSSDLINGFYSGNNSITDVAFILQDEMPFVPICFRTGVLFYNDNIENVSKSSETDIYSSIDSYLYIK